MTEMDFQALAERLAGVGEIECITPDLNGVPRGKVMTAEGFFAPRRLQMARGVMLQCIMGGYPPPGYYGGDDGDLVLRPDPNQVHRLPWSEQPRALAICDGVDMDGGLCPLSTRSLLRQVLGEYAQQGLAPVVATELEFFVFARNPDPLQPFEPPRGLDGRPETGSSAFSVTANHNLREFFAEVYEGMGALGLARDTFMHEMGISQYEINLVHGEPLLIADQTFLFKHLLKEVALKHGLIAVCMAKPLASTPGSSMHLHQSVVRADGGENIFSDGQGEETPEFRHFIGGLQAALGDLSLLFAPHVNSYQRLFHPFASPNNACWAYDNRAAGLRVPVSGPEARRVENRLPGADANPYLVIAASLAAGLRGMRLGLEPSSPAQGEFVAPQALRLPFTMSAALERLQNSELARELLGAEFIEGFAASKLMELGSYYDEITPWERRHLASWV
jgi:glutamine synthetase